MHNHSPPLSAIQESGQEPAQRDADEFDISKLDLSGVPSVAEQEARQRGRVVEVNRWLTDKEERARKRRARLPLPW